MARDGIDAGRQWSLGELCEHLALAFEATVRGSSGDGPPRGWIDLGPMERFKRVLIRQYMLLTGWFPSGVQAPNSVRPGGQLGTEDALDRLESAITAFESKCECPEATWGYHTMLGRMTGKRWRRFHTIHAAHHFRIFRQRT